MLASATAHFFLGTAKADEARAFYGDVLGLELVRDDQYGVVFRCGAGELTLSKLPEVKPAFYTALDWSVDDIEDVHDALRVRGVCFERFDGLVYDDHDTWTTPDGAARIAWFKDPDGHMLSISERRS
ncbi:MAG: VOC family protein [Pseudomonadota bacterium]